jgi:hypothetical protein
MGFFGQPAAPFRRLSHANWKKVTRREEPTSGPVADKADKSTILVEDG